ncbi:MAG: DNA repair protein RecO [Bacteroidales bacterium]|nr:DNA repair protein RecO [Bacteroidales bacterium]
MLVSSQAIVMQSIKFADTKQIVQLFTSCQGRLACIVQGIGSKKSKNKAAFFLPLTLLEIEFDYRTNRSLQQVKEIRIAEPLHDLRINTAKNAISLFLGEILCTTLKEGEHNSQIYDFLRLSILYFEHQTEQFHNFHLLFLTQLLRYLGISPINNYTTATPYFDVSISQYVSTQNTKTLNKELSELFHHIILQNSYLQPDLQINRIQRNSLLDALVSYYTQHFPGFRNLQSLAILRELFA